ncbi:MULTISPECIES: hypothetical protein [unclassified Nostoc]|uniref:hypothetical protein n=1 Tax=unclassified Nostoc TaxID=2593658 RepID=UPI002AD1D139|nr:MULTISPECIES: hypothetical protein [unclassified Nostoc]MDZ8125266.1 hypothetical protein [Nostoc sp. CmiVER01]MDZ8222247.1 hypothetical protein [Nostoc sp. ChiVER01]
MVQVIQGKDITLAQLIDQFGLQRADNEQFFSEWQQDLPDRGDDLDTVVKVLKRLADLIRNS